MKTEYKGFTINIEYDSDPINPRTEWDNFGTMVCFHRRYELGDKHKMTLEQAIDFETRDDIITLPLYLMDHGGIMLKASDFGDSLQARFDSGKVGFIYVEKDKALKEFGNVEDAIKCLKGEVETYNQFLNGQVYGYVITKPKQCDTCKHIEHEEIESCWGFYGDEENALQEAKSVVDYLVGKEK